MVSNAIRFINAYNVIDQTIRAVYNFKRNITFSDMIRRAVSLNSVVRRYEDKIIDYARLRNAIIHNSNEEMVIAEPHDDVVIEFEHIANLISQPPLALNSVATKDVLVLESNISIKKAVETMALTGYKSIPVYENESLAGVLSSGRLIEAIGAAINIGKDTEDYLQNTSVATVLNPNDANLSYSVQPATLTVQQALDLFFYNRKLSSIIITKKGNFLEKPVGIITAGDVMDLNKIIDDYKI